MERAPSDGARAEQLLPSAPVVVIEPTRRLAHLRLAELWAYRELLYFLVWRDVKVRYKQTALGAAWAILQPLLTAVVFTIFFGRLAGIPSDGLPYPLFSYAGLLAWSFFAQGLSQSSASIVGSAQLITKVYFPRLVIPIAAVLSGLVDLGLAFPVVLVMMWHYGVWPGLAVLALPFLVLLGLVATVGVGLWLSALNVEYRDVRYVVPFLVQIWLFVTPVIYPASTVAAFRARLGIPAWVLGLNPMAGVVEGFRWALLGAPTSPGPLIATSAVIGLLLLVSGALYFRSVERSFADVV
jgi:lipopolysaccharide transport system permease protein